MPGRNADPDARGAGRWHVTFTHTSSPNAGPGHGNAVGVDRSVAVAPALSTGELLHSLSLTSGERTRLRRLQQRLARGNRGSDRRERTKLADRKTRGTVSKSRTSVRGGRQGAQPTIGG